MRLLTFVVFITLGALSSAAAAEREALDISNTIQARHMPYGTVLDPVMSGTEVVSYSRCGDSAIWTGHYLAAEAFRYKVTGAPDALANATRAVRGIRMLVDVTGNDALARCAFPADSPYAAALTSEEAQHGISQGTVNGQPYLWVGDTSRDQYSGVFFGLGIAWDGIADAGLRAEIREVTGRMLSQLLHNGWLVVMPDGSISTTFLGRPDQQLTLLQIGRHIDPGRFNTTYKVMRAALSYTTILPISTEVLDSHDAYFKFNLDTINLYSLLRLEDSGYYSFWYEQAYNLLRRTTDDHGNAHFNMIDRSLNGPDARRDAETAALLNSWLARPRMDYWTDLRASVTECGDDRACSPLPVEFRVCTDFLWQRSPFLTYGGGEGNIETAGIDYILPYWMARYYGVVTE